MEDAKKIVCCLLEHGADINVANRKGIYVCNEKTPHELRTIIKQYRPETQIKYTPAFIKQVENERTAKIAKWRTGIAIALLVIGIILIIVVVAGSEDVLKKDHFYGYDGKTYSISGGKIKQAPNAFETVYKSEALGIVGIIMAAIGGIMLWAKGKKK